MTTSTEKFVMSKDVEQKLVQEPSNTTAKLITSIILIGMIVWSASSLNYDGLSSNGLAIVRNIIMFIFNPNRGGPNSVSGIDVDYVATRFFTLKSHGVPKLMYDTLVMGFMGTLLGAIISLPFAFVSSKNITGNVVSTIGSIVITLIRTVPIFIWGIVFVRVQGGAMAGVLAVAVSSIGMISKLYIEVIEDIDKGIIEALDSTGCNTLQKIVYGIIPQLTASFLSIAIYRFEINVKNATVLGMVGAGGIGAVLIDALGNSNFGLVAVCLWGLIPVVLLIEYVSTRVRTKLV